MNDILTKANLTFKRLRRAAISKHDKSIGIDYVNVLSNDEYQ